MSPIVLGIFYDWRLRLFEIVRRVGIPSLLFSVQEAQTGLSLKPVPICSAPPVI